MDTFPSFFIFFNKVITVIRQVIDYIKDDSFEVKFDNSYINIVNYLQVNYMEEEKISVNSSDGVLNIKGKNLSVIKLIDNEILIKGIITNIEIRRNNE